MTRQFFARMAAAVMIIAAGLLGTVATAQNRAITGTVVDESGVPIVGAAVVVVGNTSIGAVTDVNGVFRLNVPAGANINVSCIGYADQTVATGDRTNFRFVLVEDTEFIDETVVIGYGVQKKSDLSGAVASVSGDAIKNLSTVDAAAALQGKASGVHVLTNGAPGEGAKIRVRGYSSNTTDASKIEPLYIVDGLRVSSIQYLDPSMIQSIEVLKDAASAAIYGAEAGNGVVLVTTKSGEEGKGTVTYSAKATLQNFTRRPLMNRENMLRYIALEYGQDYVDGKLRDWDRPNPDGSLIDTDWISAYIEPSWSQQHSLSFSGGNKNGHYFASLNYVNQNGVVKGDRDVYKRLTAQINADYNIFKWLQVGTNNSIERWSTQGVSQRGYASSFDSMITLDPLTPVYWKTAADIPGEFHDMYEAVQNGTADAPYRFLGDENGFFANTPYSDVEGSPLAKRDASESSNVGYNINGSMFANFKPIQGLTITSRFGYRLNYSTSHNYTAPFYIGRGSQNNYTINMTANTGYYYQWENFANYLFSLGKHNFTLMGGMTYWESESDNLTGSVTGDKGVEILTSLEPQFHYLSNTKSGDGITKNATNSPSKHASLGYIARFIWNYDNRYGFQANFRADAYDSSKLSKANRWGYFPSFSAYWNISNEPFFKNNLDTRTFNFLKLRASWGRNGNINVLSGYKYDTVLSVANNWYQYNVDKTGSTLSTAPNLSGGLPNPNLTWEKLEQTDLGLDARLFNNRLTFTVEYFNKVTKDLLFKIDTPTELGASSSTVNGGSVQNTGVEFELGWKDQIGDFGYSISGNFSTLNNKVLSLADRAGRIVNTDASSTNFKIQTAFEEGYPIWYLRGWDYQGLNAEGKAQFMGADGKLTTTPTENDMTMIGSGTPTFTYGVNVNLFWKNFDFAMYGAGVGGNSILPVLHRTGFKNGLQYYLDAYDKGLTPHPADIVGFDHAFWSSTGNLFKGDYFRIKQMQLGYTLPARLTNRIAISNLRLYVSLDDYFTFTKYPGLDPETASTNNTSGAGLDWGSYPTMKKVIFGINVTF